MWTELMPGVYSCTPNPPQPPAAPRPRRRSQRRGRVGRITGRYVQRLPY